MDSLSRLPLAVRVAGVGAAMAVLSLAARSVDGFESGPIVCPFRLVTGLPCPFCGSTRAVGAVLQGDLVGSLALNPIGPLTMVLVVVALVAPRWTRTRWQQLKASWSGMPRRGQWLWGTAAIAALWALTISRMVATVSEQGLRDSIFFG